MKICGMLYYILRMRNYIFKEDNAPVHIELLFAKTFAEIINLSPWTGQPKAQSFWLLFINQNWWTIKKSI